MKYETNEYIIYYNECDKEYINGLIEYFEKEKIRIFKFFNIEKLNKKLIIKLYDEIDKYSEYRNYKINETSIGNMDFDDNNYYIHMLSYKEIIKRKGHDQKQIIDFYKLLIHEFVHVCHENYGTCHKVLRWITEGIAIILSNQNYNEGLIDCNLENLLNNGNNYYNNYYTLLKYAYQKYGENYIKKLVFDPNFGKEQTSIIYNEYINNYKVVLKEDYIKNKEK